MSEDAEMSTAPEVTEEVAAPAPAAPEVIDHMTALQRVLRMVRLTIDNAGEPYVECPRLLRVRIDFDRPDFNANRLPYSLTAGDGR